MIRDDNGLVLLELIGENDLSKMALYRELNTPAASRDLAKFIMRGEKTPLLEDWAFERLLK